LQLFVFTDAGRVCRPLFIVDPIDEENGVFEQSLRITGEHIEEITDMEERLDAFNANPDDPDVYMDPEDKFVSVFFCWASRACCEIHVLWSEL
jgi:hypothetical protein